MNKSNIDMCTINRDYYKERMERYGKLLVSDYDEDLEKLYNGYGEIK